MRSCAGFGSPGWDRRESSWTSRRSRRLALVAIAAHLTGTFLVFVQAPSWAINGHNSLLLTANGEFVLKNLVLISAALVLLTQTARQSQPNS